MLETWVGVLVHIDSMNDSVLCLGLHSTILGGVCETHIRIDLAQTAEVGEIIVVVRSIRVIRSQPIEIDK